MARHLAMQNASVGKPLVPAFMPDSPRASRIVMACRRVEKCLEAAKEINDLAGSKRVDALPCDLASFKSTKQFAVDVSTKLAGVDSLILVAGVAQIPFGLTEDGLEKHIGTSVMARTTLKY